MKRWRRLTASFVSAGPVTPRCRRASTLIELVVTVAILAIATAVATLAVRAPEATRVDDEWTKVGGARRAAIRDGRASTVLVRVRGRLALATAFPDGSVIADSAIEVDALTAELRAPLRPMERLDAP